MTRDLAELQALVSIMDGQYQRIRQIEGQYQIVGVDGDMRPRIEYYHDAVRVLTSGEDDPYSKYDRLAPERLAYDVAILRQIIAKPFHAGRGAVAAPLQQDIIVHGSMGGVPEPDRKVKAELGQFYKDYTVLFVALLAPKVEDNTQLRSEEAEQVMQDCAMLKDAIQRASNGKMDVQALLQTVEMVDHDDLRRGMHHLIAHGSLDTHDMRKAAQKLDDTKERIKQEQKVLQQASLNFSTGQLAVYEDSKETVRRLASQGMNIAGKFVENAVSQSRGSGRGQGI